MSNVILNQRQIADRFALLASKLPSAPGQASFRLDSAAFTMPLVEFSDLIIEPVVSAVKCPIDHTMSDHDAEQMHGPVTAKSVLSGVCVTLRRKYDEPTDEMVQHVAIERTQPQGASQ